MPIVFIVIALLSAYLLGSVPSSVWIGKILYNIDIREHGSGNAGATNAIRVLGWKAGVPSLVFDILKGFAAVNFIHFTDYYIPDTGDFINIQLLLGIAALLGHIFPVYIGFKGGKGVATLVGVVMAIDPNPTLICAGIFILALIFTKYVSLSSMIAGFSFPIMVIFVFKTTTTSLVIFSLIIFVLLLFTHQKNIERLLRKEENKATFLIINKQKRRAERLRQQERLSA